MKWIFLPSVVVLVLFLGACGSGAGSSAGGSTTTVVQTQTVTEPAASAPAPAAGNSAPSNTGKIRVPDVVGKDHQLAQDTMQAEGLYNLAEEDATGQGRLLIIDRNWTVVSQSPPAGSMVNSDQTITLRSKKDGE